MLEEDYTQYQAKYNLPSFSQLEQEFNLLQLDTEYPLDAIRKQMQDKIESLIDILADILQPTPESIAQMHEYNYISEEEKQLILTTFKELNFLLRAIHESQLENKEESTASVIKEVASQWPTLKNNSLPILKKLKESWKKEIQTQQIVGYFG